MKKLIIGALVIAPLILMLHVAMAIPAWADVLAVAFDFANSPVYDIDSTTGAGVLIGSCGFPRLNNLARNSAGVFHSVGGLGDNALLSVNPTTGACTSVATTSVADFRGLAYSSADALFGIVNGSPIDQLYTIDPTTGAATLVGGTGLTSLQGLAFSPGGTLYGWDLSLGLVTINPATGAATDVNPAIGEDAEIQALAFRGDGTLFGARNSLFTIDAGTGAATFVGTGGYVDVRGIEFMIVQRVPEASTVLLFGTALAAAGILRRRTAVTAIPS